VIIAGGGPVGLLLACELRLAEVGVVVLERTPDGADEPRQVGLHSRTLEMLDRRGLRERFKAAQPDLSELAEFRSGLADGRARGHFAGLFALGRFPVATDQPGALFPPARSSSRSSPSAPGLWAPLSATATR
jgi:FAD binding domain